ncbi:MAG: recombination-associated protein RdgC [Burkholderiaceae bacterium]|nr:recombination-associated protein RdgC [Burkholderiaceae bacterium]
MNAFFRNALVYRLESGWRLDADALDEQLASMRFTPGTSVQSQSAGWVAAIEHGRLAHAVGGQVLLTLRVEKKLLPASVVNQFARARAQEHEERQGYKPGRRQLREIKEAVTEELIPKAFSIFRDTRVWLDPVGGWLAIDTSSPARAEEVIGILSKSLDPFPLRPLQVRSSPAAAMTGWLTTDEPPAGFAIDQDAELQASGESRAAVRFLRESIDAADVRRHVAAGKRCTRLALTWNDRIAFVLTESLALKRIAPLDVLKEGDDDTADAAERFDSDFSLMAGELSRLLGDLVEALGGPAKASDPAGDAVRAIDDGAPSRAAAGEALPA